jgi:integrase/recombinase XerD
VPRQWFALGQEISNYLMAQKLDRNCGERTLELYEYTIRYAFKALEDGKRTLNPRKITRDDLNWLKDEFMVGTSERYKANVVSTLLQFLRWAGNTDVGRMRVSFSNLPTTRVRWLEDEEAMHLKAIASGIDKMFVHCELDLGMRRAEMLGLKVEDFKSGHQRSIHVLGKGRNGGKHRDIPWHPDTPGILEEWLATRDEVIEQSQKRNPAIEVPPYLFIHEVNGKMMRYQKSMVEKHFDKLGLVIGKHFSNHDLRRTCGRMMHRSGVPTERIMKIFGHSDPRTTVHYLGLDLDDMSEAMTTYAQYQRNLIVPKMEHFEKSQMRSGQGGIRTPGFRLAKAAIFR